MIARVGPSDANVLDHRRERHRQGRRRAGAARRLEPRRRGRWSPSTPAACRKACSRASCSATCKGAFTDAKSRPRRPLRARRRRHAVPRRDRQRPAQPAGQAAARARDRRVRARRIVAHAPRRRAHHLGDQRRPRRRSRGRPLPPGPALPPEHDRDPPAAAARAARGHPAARAALPAAARAALPQARSPASSSGAMQVLLEHPWPGNVRELDHAVERAVLMAQGAARQPRRPRPAHRPRRRRRASRT